MTLEEALNLYPPEGTPLSLVLESPSRYREASYVIANEFRRLWAEHLVMLRAVNAMNAGAQIGENFSLVHTAHIRNAKEVMDKLYGTEMLAVASAVQRPSR